LLACEAFIGHVEQLFHGKEFSLDAIVGVAKLKGDFPASQMVCTKRLYNYVDAGLLDIANIDLPLKLKRTSKPKRVRQNKKRLGRSISERPDSINNRSEFGHWEIGTVIGRKTKDDEAGPHFSMVFKSITSDNGSEFSDLSTLGPQTTIYFTHPYNSSQRATNERHKGLINRFIPKGRRMSDYSIDFVSKIQTWCNSLPWKILGYLSPDQAFEDF